VSKAVDLQMHRTVVCPDCKKEVTKHISRGKIDAGVDGTVMVKELEYIIRCSCGYIEHAKSEDSP
jgi:hypothetical protein